jgi:hypothetical protein
MQFRTKDSKIINSKEKLSIIISINYIKFTFVSTSVIQT